MNVKYLKQNIVAKSQRSKIEMTKDEYYNRSKTFEYRIVFWCFIGFVGVLLLTLFL